jgi:hypothetical protein
MTIYQQEDGKHVTTMTYVQGNIYNFLTTKKSIMGKIHRLSDAEKELINIIGRLPEKSQKELLNYTTYKWVSTVVRKLEHLKEQDIAWGPYYAVDYGRLCVNPLHIVVCVIESSQTYETVISYLKLVESLKWIYPVLSPHKRLLHVGFISSDDAETNSLLEILKGGGVISDYVARVCSCKWVLYNPDFFGDPNPLLDTLLEPRELPDMSFGAYDTKWNECDIRILPYLQAGFKDAKLIDILREEKKMFSREWSYDQIKYSHEKMIKKGLIEKKYSISPYPRNQCAHFVLFFKTEDISLTHRILHNFALDERIFKEYTLCGDWGMLACQSHPVFLTDLMNKLDQVDEITEKELYQLRSYPGKYFFKKSVEDSPYNFDTQTLEYPYHVYRERIEDKLSNKSL